MADAFGLGVHHRATVPAPAPSAAATAWQWSDSLGGGGGGSLGLKQASAARRAGRCVALIVGAVVGVCVLVGVTGVLPGSDSASKTYIVRAPEVAHIYHPHGSEPLQALRVADGDGTLADGIDRKTHARLRRAMDRACRGMVNASGASPTYLMATEFVLRSDDDENEIVRHFGYRMGCVCRFNACLWLEDPEVMQQNEHGTVTFMCSDTIQDGAAPVKTIRALPYRVVNSDGREFVASTVEEACQVGLMVDVLSG